MISAEGAAKIRRCRKCHVEFSGKVCKACRDARNREYRQNHPEKVRQARAKFYEENPGKVAAYNAAWRAKNPEKFNSLQIKWRSENPERILARAKRYKDQMGDGYIASLLGFKVEQIPKELIELKRVHVKIARQLKEAK